MSIKIYYGQRLPSMSMEQLLEVCRTVQLNFRQAIIRSLRSQFTPEEYGKRWVTLGDLLDFQAEAVFFPLPDKLLVIPFWGRRDLYNEIWELVTGAVPYGYWDNVDPDDCSEEEWEQRKRDWHLALLDHGDGVPATNGFTFTFVNSMPLPEEFAAAAKAQSYQEPP